jgi:hypothetical protein
LNNYHLKTESWVKAQTYKLRHHKQCNFDFFFVPYDPKKLKPRHKWRDTDKDDEKEPDDKEEDKAEEEDKKKPDDDDEEDDVKPVKKPEPLKPATAKPTPKPVVPTTRPWKPKPQPEPKKGEFNPEYGLYVERDFYIVSTYGIGRYVDIVGNQIVIKTQSDRTSQKWWFDQKSKTIKNKSNNRSFDIQHAGKTSNMQVWNTNGGWFQVFKYYQNYIMNVKDSRVLEITGSKDVEGQRCGVSKKTYTINQKWTVIYVDKAEDLKTKGMYTPYGIHLARPFYIRSRLPMQRVLQVVGGRNIVLKTMNRKTET